MCKPISGLTNYVSLAIPIEASLIVNFILMPIHNLCMNEIFQFFLKGHFLNYTRQISV